nr:MAG TPA: hypothetical protein [Caudoviricetes sp.]
MYNQIKRNKNDSNYFDYGTYLYMCYTFTSRIFSKVSNRNKRYTFTCYFHYVLCSYLFTSVLKMLPLSNLPLSNTNP